MWTSLRISRKFSITSALGTRTQRRKTNPGLGHQITAFEDVPDAMQDDPEGFGDMETDFANVHHLHKNHELELSQQRDINRQFVVKSKYFPSKKLPNFLTYAEKEQIRLLHNKDGEQWSVDVLAESFPANYEIIHKVIKANWKSSSAKRIQSHDEGVSKNWQLFQKGEFNNLLSKELQEHLRKFIDRNKVVEQTNIPKRTDYAPLSKEFSSIVAIGSKQAEPSRNTTESPKQDSVRVYGNNEDEETYLLDKIKDKKNIRLKELKETKLKSDLELTVYNSNINTTGITEDLSQSFCQKFALNEVVIGEADKKRYEISSVKDRICIPRKLRREGATYRIDDCYYDDDGEFLYRVPGMTAGPRKT